jgi:cytochrome c-type biogenesis protein CcmE
MFTGRLKFLIGGLLVLTAVIYLVISSTQANVEYFMTVDEIHAEGEEALGKSVRLSGAVIGKTILYDPDTMTLTFEIANIPGTNEEIESQGGLSQALHEAVTDSARSRLLISYSGVKPDLLQDEAQAIITGHLSEDGIFYADELLLKCPTRYEGAVPHQAIEN